MAQLRLRGRVSFWLNLHNFVTSVKARQLLEVISISSGKPVKKKPCVLPRWSHIFNSIIEVNGLKEIKLIGR
jgi:hypothetical protein